MDRNELFTEFARAAMHASGEVFHGMPNETLATIPNNPRPEMPVQEPIRQIQRPALDLDVDIHSWLRRRDHVLDY